MNKPKIGIIDNSVDVTGALKSITRTSFDLEHYFEFEFIVPKHSKGTFWIEKKGFSQIHELPLREINKSFVSVLLYLPFLFWNAITLNRIVKSKKISLLHVNDVYNLLPVALRFLGCKTPYVCHIRFMPDRFPAWLFNFWLKMHLRYADRIIAVSKSVLKRLPHHDKIEQIYNELPTDTRYPNGLNTTNTTRRYFLYLANFIQGKGQDFGLEAFARIAEELPEWNIRFVGGDMGLAKNQEYKMKLIRKSEDLGLKERIEWNAFTEDVEREYKQADIVLNFSESESFSITCVEAMFFGSALIATDCGGPAEIVDNNTTGLLVPNRDVASMAKAMLQLARDSEKRERMTIVASKSVRERFSIENTSLRLKDVYDDILSLKE